MQRNPKRSLKSGSTSTHSTDFVAYPQPRIAERNESDKAVAISGKRALSISEGSAFKRVRT